MGEWVVLCCTGGLGVRQSLWTLLRLRYAWWLVTPVTVGWGCWLHAWADRLVLLARAAFADGVKQAGPFWGAQEMRAAFWDCGWLQMGPNCSESITMAFPTRPICWWLPVLRGQLIA